MSPFGSGVTAKWLPEWRDRPTWRTGDRCAQTLMMMDADECDDADDDDGDFGFRSPSRPDSSQLGPSLYSWSQISSHNPRIFLSKFWRFSPPKSFVVLLVLLHKLCQMPCPHTLLNFI